MTRYLKLSLILPLVVAFFAVSMAMDGRRAEAADAPNSCSIVRYNYQIWSASGIINRANWVKIGNRAYNRACYNFGAGATITTPVTGPIVTTAPSTAPAPTQTTPAGPSQAAPPRPPAPAPGPSGY